MARRGDEGPTRFPLDALGIDNLAFGVDFGAHQGVAAGVAIDDQIEGHRLVPMGWLDYPGGYDSEHGPEGVGDRAALGQVPIGQ